MADFSYEQVAATLASGILAADPEILIAQDPDNKAGIAIDLYRECLKQLRKYPKGDGPRIRSL